MTVVQVGQAVTAKPAATGWLLATIKQTKQQGNEGPFAVNNGVEKEKKKKRRKKKVRAKKSEDGRKARADKTKERDEERRKRGIRRRKKRQTLSMPLLPRDGGSSSKQKRLKLTQYIVFTRPCTEQLLGAH